MNEGMEVIYLSLFLVYPVWFHVCQGSNSIYSFHVEQSGVQMKINTSCIVWDRVTTVSEPWKGYTLAWKGYTSAWKSYTLAWSRYPHKFTRFLVDCHSFLFSKQNTQHGVTTSFLVDLPALAPGHFMPFCIILELAYFFDMILELRKKRHEKSRTIGHTPVFHESWSPKARRPVR